MIRIEKDLNLVKLNSSQTRNVISSLAQAFRGDGLSMRSSGVQLVSRMNRVEINTAKKQNSLDKQIERVLKRFGGYTRTTAKNSMRYRRVKRVDPKKVWRVTVSQAAKAQPFVQQELFTPKGLIDLPYKAYPRSKPGYPPFAHELPLLRKGVMFATDRKKLNVVIGPIPAAQGIAELLEYGGTASRKVAYKRNEFGQLILSNLKGYMKQKNVRYKARPYMRPAFGETLFKLSEFLDESDLGQSFKDVIWQRASAASFSGKINYG